MVLVRNVFQLEFGKAKQAKALWKEGLALDKKFGSSSGRVLSDITGPFYTLVFEAEYKSLTDMESHVKNAFGNKEWEEWYAKFVPLVKSGHREMYTIVEQ